MAEYYDYCLTVLCRLRHLHYFSTKRHKRHRHSEAGPVLTHDVDCSRAVYSSLYCDSMVSGQWSMVSSSCILYYYTALQQCVVTHAV